MQKCAFADLKMEWDTGEIMWVASTLRASTE